MQPSKEFIYNDIRKKIHTYTKEDYTVITDFLKNKNWEYCAYCKIKFTSKYKTNPPYLTISSIDHVIPLSKGGKNNLSNIEIVCTECNVKKGTLPKKFFIENIALLKK